MPNCFELIRKGHEEPSFLQEIDNELWREFTGSVPNPNDKWYRYWYDTIGLDLAMGRTFEEIKAALPENTKMLPVVEYLEENYTARAWYEPKRR